MKALSRLLLGLCDFVFVSSFSSFAERHAMEAMMHVRCKTRVPHNTRVQQLAARRRPRAENTELVEVRKVCIQQQARNIADPRQPV